MLRDLPLPFFPSWNFIDWSLLAHLQDPSCPDSLLTVSCLTFPFLFATFVYLFIYFFLRQGLSLDLELPRLGWPAREPPLPQIWDYKLALTVSFGFYGSKQTSCLCGDHFTAWALSPALFLVFILRQVFTLYPKLALNLQSFQVAGVKGLTARSSDYGMCGPFSDHCPWIS